MLGLMFRQKEPGASRQALCFWAHEGAQSTMGKTEVFRARAAEFEALAAEADSQDLRETYNSLARSYRKLAGFMEKQDDRTKTRQ
jgi:hypothetical protein